MNAKQRLLILIFLLSNVLGLRADSNLQFYVRPSASGSGTGKDWNNAFTNLPSRLLRGGTYYLAAGYYGNYTFADSEDGTNMISIKKATPSDHGLDLGWENSYSAGQAIFGRIEFSTGHYILDGQDGEQTSNLSGYIEYGFAARMENVMNNQQIINIYDGVQDIMINHLEACYTTPPRTGIWYHASYIVRNAAGPGIESVTFSHCWLHDSANGIYNGYCTAILFDHCILERNGHAQVAMNFSPSEHSEIAAIKDGTATFRYCLIRDWRSTGGLIAFSVNTPSVIVYGCLFTQTEYWNTPTEADDSNGVINGLSAAEGITILCYNSTFANLKYGSLLATAGQYARQATLNCIFYNCVRANGNHSLVLGGFHDYNWFYNSGTQTEEHLQNGSQNAFIDPSSGNFHLAFHTHPGLNLGPPYNLDSSVTLRGGTAVWDRGAFQFSEPSELQPPQNLKVK